MLLERDIVLVVSLCFLRDKVVFQKLLTSKYTCHGSLLKFPITDLYVWRSEKQMLSF
jgi:hypothetical protein